jgi:hypothetical protein
VIPLHPSRKTRNKGTPKRSVRPAKPHKPNHAKLNTDTTSAFEAILILRQKLDTGEITRSQFRRLIHLEDMRSEWAARVQLRAVCRDLLPQAASQARKGRSRMLAVIGNILLKSEVSELKSRDEISGGQLAEERRQQQIIAALEGQRKSWEFTTQFFGTEFLRSHRGENHQASKTEQDGFDRKTLEKLAELGNQESPKDAGIQEELVPEEPVQDKDPTE